MKILNRKDNLKSLVFAVGSKRDDNSLYKICSFGNCSVQIGYQIETVELWYAIS